MIITKGLYVVATPIGNLNDISLRALEILKSVNLIIAEDTRHSERLLKHFAIDTKLTSFHSHNENEKTDFLIQKLLDGQTLALISDAGTPLISDPGYPLVAKAKSLAIPVIPIPGASALIAALSVSGLPCHHFSFEGFLPVKNQARKECLKALEYETRTLIFYEAPHRILSCLEDMIAIFGEERRACVARELTKHYESIQTNNLKTLLENFKALPETQQGEFVIIIAGFEKNMATTDKVLIDPKFLLKNLIGKMPLKQAAQFAEQLTGIRKNIFYQMGLDFAARND